MGKPITVVHISPPRLLRRANITTALLYTPTTRNPRPSVHTDRANVSQNTCLLRQLNPTMRLNPVGCQNETVKICLLRLIIHEAVALQLTKLAEDAEKRLLRRTAALQTKVGSTQFSHTEGIKIVGLPAALQDTKSTVVDPPTAENGKPKKKFSLVHKFRLCKGQIRQTGRSAILVGITVEVRVVFVDPIGGLPFPLCQKTGFTLALGFLSSRPVFLE
ncbi:Hypothetical protein NTJ_11885 [Nesidiocoris tenuis]|uniref:Uncharacterized protein n=1 Tax=Nesidiocoris tenuis TaxID=355587 RepID=A0ABN7B3U1_9HEMI|nr:Hypothetical protein NTJ_11885 [Nesidiocoris tenuis]